MTLDPKECKAGQEQWEEFQSHIAKRVTMIQYDYRNSKGELFSCITQSLDKARKRRDIWAEKHGM